MSDTSRKSMELRRLYFDHKEGMQTALNGLLRCMHQAQPQCYANFGSSHKTWAMMHDLSVVSGQLLSVKRKTRLRAGADLHGFAVLRLVLLDFLPQLVLQRVYCLF